MLVTRRVLAPSKSLVTWSVLMLWVALTALWTIDPKTTLLTLGQFAQLFAFFAIVAVYPVERKDVRILAAITTISGTFAGAYGIVLFLQGGQVNDRLAISNGSGIYLDPNHFAASLLLPLAFAIGALIESRGVLLRVAAGVSALVMVSGLFLTGSRGGIIAFAIMLLFIAWKTRYRLQILGFMTVSAFLSLLSPTVWQRFADPTQGAGSGRLFIWNAAAHSLKDFGLLGAGLGSFPAVYNKELLAIYQPIFQGWSRPAHNTLITAFVELGVFGGCLLLYCWWSSFRDARGNVVVESAVLALLVASLFLDTMLFKYVWLSFSFSILAANAANPRFLRGGSRQQLPANRGLAVTPVAQKRQVLVARRPGKNPQPGFKTVGRS